MVNVNAGECQESLLRKHARDTPPIGGAPLAAQGYPSDGVVTRMIDPRDYRYYNKQDEYLHSLGRSKAGSQPR